MNKPARFTQAELARAIRAADALGKRVAIRDGVIEIVDRVPISESQERRRDPVAPIEPGKEFAL